MLYSNGNLAFSKDTVVFDTVFTTIGSTTMQLKIYNRSNRTLKIDEIELMGGGSSPFRINFDGLMGTNFNNIEIEGGDSLYTFVEVTLNPNGVNLPMVIEDKIRFRSNGADQFVILAAWGQDMYYHYSDIQNDTFNLNEGTWPNDKPHLIYGAAFIDEGKSLIIQQNTKIYMHANSFLYTYKGTLTMNGTKDEPIIVQGDRLEAEYADISGQYYGIYFDSAQSSSINYAIIKNATVGIHIEGNGMNGANPTVTVRNTKIYNSNNYGILNYFGGKVKAENCIIAKSGVSAFINIGGSEFDFNHCDLLGYNSTDQQRQAVIISNYAVVDQTANQFGLTGRIVNCVIFGEQDSEIGFDTLDGGNNILISYSLIKRSPAGSGGVYGAGMIWNQTPYFQGVGDNNYEIWSNSPLINAGTAVFQTLGNIDLKGIARTATPTIGAYQYQ